MSDCSLLSSAITLTILYILYKTIKGIYVYCIRKPKDLLHRYSQPDSPFKTWACVTGATDGIGLGFCQQLASIGFNVLLLSRSEDKLIKRQIQLQNAFPQVKFSYIVANLGQDQSVKFYQDICAKINEFNIGLFINNAGIMYQGEFQNITPQEVLKTMEVNMTPQAMLLKFILPKMMNKRKCRSGVINVSSIGGVMPHACNAIYSGTKGFNDLFSRGLSLEVQDKVDMMCLRPGGVQSNITRIRAGYGIITAIQCAKSALDKLGHDFVTYGDWQHAFGAHTYLYLIDILPKKMKAYLFRQMYKFANQKLLDKVD